MVLKVRKILFVVCALLITAGATCTAVSAANYTTYDGNISTTQLTYFRDILPHISITDNYVVARTDQNQYIMCVGKLDYNNGVFTLNEPGRIYILDTNGTNYNNYYTYSNDTIEDFKLTVGNKLIYSDLGEFPQLEERGQRYEIIQTVIISTVCVCAVVRSIFYFRKR